MFQCKKYKGYQKRVLSLWNKRIPLCVEVLLVATCACEESTTGTAHAATQPSPNGLLLEQWYFNISYRR